MGRYLVQLGRDVTILAQNAVSHGEKGGGSLGIIVRKQRERWPLVLSSLSSFYSAQEPSLPDGAAHN